jgi:hypothetical protein
MINYLKDQTFNSFMRLAATLSISNFNPHYKRFTLVTKDLNMDIDLPWL